MVNPKRQRKLTGFEDDVKPESNEETAPSVPPNHSQDPAQNGLRDKTVYVIDAHSLIYQVFHALPEMSGPNGQPVGAIHGFVRDIVDILEKKEPDYLFCAFDAPGDTFRHELYSDYKIDRDEMPVDLRLQIPNIRRMLDAMEIASLDLPGFEADDLLATIATEVEQLGGRCVVVTGDKDCRQLISDYVRVYNIRKDEYFDADALMEVWGVRPDQVVDFQSLVGDKVDNVPGVPLIGPKLARELLEKYDTLENVLDHAADVSGKKRSESLMNGRDQALLSRELVRLKRDVPIKIQWEQCAIGEFKHEQIEPLCREFGFRSLAQRLVGSESITLAKKLETDYQTIDSVERLQWLARQLAEQTRFSVDTETSSTNPRAAEIVGLSFAWEPAHAFYVPVKSPAGEPRLELESTLSTLKPVLEDPAIQKIGQNLKYDIVVLRGCEVSMAGVAFDTMVADYLLAPGERAHNIDDMAKRYLRHETIKISALIGSGKNQKRMDEVPVSTVTEYAAEDADIPLRLCEILHDRLVEEELHELFTKLEMPLVDVLAELEFNGIRIDVQRCQELSSRYAIRMEELEREIYELAGREFNIASVKQLAAVLFDELELPVVKKTRTGRSTDVEVLNELAKLHALPAKLVEYRHYAKLKSTYVDALPKLVLPRTGRVHGSFTQDIAATGRLSSKDPNLQNIPIRSSEGREIRSAFLPAEGWKLLTADYSQIELRVLAHYCGDETLRSAFFENQDIHTRVAGEVYGVPLDEVTGDMRRSAKAINFGIIYGQSPFGLAKSLGISKDEAAEFIDAYFAKYPGVEQFVTKVLELCNRNRYVTTILGRRRPIGGVRSSEKRGDSRQRNLPERIAINTVIQGSAADLIKQAMIDIHRRMRDEKFQARMLLQIHDELVFEVPPNEFEQLAALVNDRMVHAHELDVPLKVDIKSGDNWAECEPI
jgi:DNA polymerase-1